MLPQTSLIGLGHTLKLFSYSIFFLTLFSTNQLRAQVNKGFKLLKKGLFEEAEMAFLQDTLPQQKELKRAAAYYGLAKIKLDNKKAVLELEDYFSAGAATAKSLTIFKGLSPKIQRKANKKYYLSNRNLENTYNKLLGEAVELLEVNRDVTYYDEFSRYFPLAGNRKTQPKVDQARLTMINNTLRQYRPPYEPLLSIRKNHLNFLKVNNLRYTSNLEGKIIRSFIRNYGFKKLDQFKKDNPDHWVSVECWFDEFFAAIKEDAPKKMAAFIKDHPFTVLDNFMMEAIGNMKADGTFKTASLNAEEQKVIDDLMLGDKISRSIRYKDTSDQIFQQLLTFLPENAPSFRAYGLFQDALQMYLLQKQWNKVRQLVIMAQPLFPDERPKDCNINYTYYSGKQEWFNTAIPILTKATQTNVPFPIEEINQKYTDEISPVISADGTTLYFSSNNRLRSKGGADIYQSRFLVEENKWGRPSRVDSLSSESYEAPLSITADGSTMLIYKNGKLHESQLDKNGWTSPKLLPSVINDFKWVGTATISRDGEVLIYEASNKEVNEEGDEDIDLYISIKDSIGNWQQPFSIGNDINTSGMERFPYLSTDSKTLYFSSNGHGGLGMIDVFVTKRLNDSWTSWARPMNMGKEINTLEDDMGYRISGTAKGDIAYFSSDETLWSSQGDIYTTGLPAFAQADPLSIVKVKLNLPNNLPPDVRDRIKAFLTDTTGAPIADVSLTADNELIGVLPDSIAVALLNIIEEKSPKDPNPSLIPPQQIVIPNDNKTEETDGNKVINMEVPVPFVPNLIKREERIPIKYNFESDSFNFNPSLESQVQLRSIVKWVSKTPFTVNIYGHTDNVGTKEYNDELSRKRAQSVFDYLQLLGLPEERMVILPRGMSDPIDSNEDEEGKNRNRRVELFFTLPKKGLN